MRLMQRINDGMHTVGALALVGVAIWMVKPPKVEDVTRITPANQVCKRCAALGVADNDPKYGMMCMRLGPEELEALDAEIGLADDK